MQRSMICSQAARTSRWWASFITCVPAVPGHGPSSCWNNSACRRQRTGLPAATPAECGAGSAGPGARRRAPPVLLPPQYLEEADRLAHRIAVIGRGKIITCGTADQLKDQAGGGVVELRV